MKYCKYHPINPTQILMLLRLRFAMIFNQLCSAFFSCLQPNCCKCHNIQSHLWLWQQGWVFSYPHLYKMIVLLIVGWLSYWFLYKNTDSWPNCKSWTAWLNSHVCSLPASLVILLFKSFFFFFFFNIFYGGYWLSDMTQRICHLLIPHLLTVLQQILCKQGNWKNLQKMIDHDFTD